MSPPAGRPRKGTNTDLPPRLLRRPSTRSPSGFLFYYLHRDGHKEPLGGDEAKARQRWHEIEMEPLLAHTEGFTAIANAYRQEAMPRLALETRKGYEKYLRRLEAVFKTSPLNAIKPRHIGALKRELRDSPVAFNRMKATLSALWFFALENGLTDAPNPCKEIHRHTEKASTVRVTDEMYHAVYDRGDQVLRDWMDLTLTAGQRVNDILELRRTDITLDDAGRRCLGAYQAKTKKTVPLAVEADLDAVLERLLTRQRKISGPYLIQTDSGQRVTYAMIRKRFDQAQRAAAKDWEKMGKEWTYFQRRDLRAKSATDADTIEEAQQRLGHELPSTTARHYRRQVTAKPGRLPKKT